MQTLVRWTMLVGLGLGQAAWAGPSSGSGTSGTTASGGVNAPSDRADQQAKADAASKEHLKQKVAAANASFEKRLSVIVIPAFKVEGAAARDVFKLIRDQAKENDPETHGFNLLFTCKATALDAPVTMDMTNVPVPDLLHFVALAAGVDLKYEAHAVVVMNHVAKE